MANPIFKFTLSHSAAGSLQISEPDGWKDVKLKLERHADFRSLIEYFDGTFTFYGNNGRNNGGIDFIRQVEQTYGFDTTLLITITISTDSGYNYQTVFIGQLDLSQILELENNKLQCPIIRNDFWAKFINRLDTPVNISSLVDLDNNSISPVDPVEVTLTSQVIRQIYKAHLTYNAFFTPAASTKYYGVLDFDAVDKEEILDTFHYTIGQSSSLPFEKFFLQFAGETSIQCKVTIADYQGDSIFGNFNQFNSTIGKIKVYLQINGNDPIAFTQTDHSFGPRTFILNNGLSVLVDSSTVTEYTIDTVLQLKKSDAIRIYTLQEAADATGLSAHIFGIKGDGPLDGAVYTVNPIDPSDLNTIGNFIGFWDPSTGNFPSTTQRNVFWQISHDGFIHGIPVFKEWIIKSIVTTPGQTTSNWYVGKYNITENFYQYGETYLNVTVSTTTPSTRSEGYLMHDVFAGISDRITGTSNSFYSDYIGGTLTNQRSYLVDGCKWNYVNIKGLQIRHYLLSTKPFFQSFNDQWKGANPIFNLGIGYDNKGGNEVIRLEQQSFFFEDTISINLNFVKSIQRSYDNDYLFNKIEIGYSQWESDNTFGIDDAQTKHTYATPIKKSGKDISLYSEFVAASLAIETTRRVSLSVSTTNNTSSYKYDNNTFIIAINPQNTSPETFIPELDENFIDIGNLSDADTRYNSQLTPSRNLLRWLNHVNGCLQNYIGSSLKFVLGEGNFDMISALSSSSCNSYISELSEKQNIAITDDYLFIPLAYEIEIDMQWGEYQTIRDNRNKAIGISQTNSGHKAFFIKTLEYDICHSKCKIVAWPKNYLQITNTDFVGQALAACDVIRITEEDDVRLLESGEKRIIE